MRVPLSPAGYPEAAGVVSRGAGQPGGAEPRQVFFDFADPRASRSWSSVDDVVMGGNSESKIGSTAEGTAVFSGIVVLEGGGFASVRADLEPPRDLSGSDGVALVVRGDGKRYAVTLRDDQHETDFPAYRASFGTQAGGWETVMLPTQEFEPFFRGQELEEAPPLNLAAISAINLLIAERQGGEFRLEVERMFVYRSTAHGPAGEGSRDPSGNAENLLEDIPGQTCHREAEDRRFYSHDESGGRREGV